MNSKRKIALLLVILLLAPPAWAETARAQLERFAAGVESLEGRFRPVGVSTEQAVQDRSDGPVWLGQALRVRGG